MVNSKPLFEQGPIRPPSEAKSLLLRLTRNCPWNRCLFCPVYKGEKFSRRDIIDIKADIVAMAEAVDKIRDLSEKSGYKGEVNRRIAAQLQAEKPELFHLAFWLHHGGANAFLQDGDSLLLPVDELIEILTFLKEKMPTIERITTYARSRTVLRRSVEELKAIKEAGLSRIHIGLESGNDKVLAFMKKGVTGKQHVEAGRRVKTAGLSLSEYVIIGLGGKKLWREHALDTARVLNMINPDYIRLRTLAVPSSSPLFKEMQLGNFKTMTDDDLIREEALLIESLENIESFIYSDHILNLLEEINGKLPEGKPLMLKVIDNYLSLQDYEREIFRLGRRAGYFRSLDDLSSESLCHPVENLYRQLQEKGLTVDDYIEDLIMKFI